MKGYSASDYGRGYGAGRRYSERQIEAMRAQIEALKQGIHTLVEMLNEAEAPLTMVVPRLPPMGSASQSACGCSVHESEGVRTEHKCEAHRTGGVKGTS